MLLTNTIVHNVHFWLNNPADRQKLIDGLKTLESITFFKAIHIGVPANTHPDATNKLYDVSLLLLFDTPEALKAYEVHQTHQSFINNTAKPLCSKVVISDSINV